MKPIIFNIHVISRYITAAFLLPIFILTSCGKDEEIYYSLDGVPYAKGIKVIDLTTLNDCTLSICSDQRVTRLSLTDVTAFIRKDSIPEGEFTILQVTFTFDSVIEFYVCNEDIINFTHEPGDMVKFSGIAKDGCGYLYHPFPVEEEYFINVSKIEKI